ncbi:MAG TPA: VWA-like domain-containing protein [Ktedonobacteraceae bacterium]|nr:VWA-like domain-containing protein [Ktedonobacteraceae bacterium]
MAQKNRSFADEQQARLHIHTGWHHISQHLLFRSLAQSVRLVIQNEVCPPDGWAVVGVDGVIYADVSRHAPPERWAYVFAHCLLHLAFGHFDQSMRPFLKEWNAACDCYIAHFLAELDNVGEPPKELKTLLFDLRRLSGASASSEKQLFNVFCRHGVPIELLSTGTAGATACDMSYTPLTLTKKHKKQATGNHQANTDWQARFANGLASAVSAVVSNVGRTGELTTASSQVEQARNWFIGHFPLLGALAVSFEIIENDEICRRLGIEVAAINTQQQKIYINPHAYLDELELRFVMAHELLHAGLRHDVRCAGRDPFLWNVACDYVVNEWLVDMRIGRMPEMGLLYDRSLKGESAEAIYDRLVIMKRRHPHRPIFTLGGRNQGDILGQPGWWRRGQGITLDEFYRSSMVQGLHLHELQERGYLSAGLIEEIRAMQHPPIPWEIELAQWFDHRFQPTEKTRSYARLSRRQSSTPDIPRPRWMPGALRTDYLRTFGVILDTSGSMGRLVLAKALGAIASYSLAHEVQAARVVFCDAEAYDQGYMTPTEIAGRVRLKGRGGTLLQPGIDALEHAKDFPEDGPLLIITDGMCDVLQTRRSHAFLMPDNRSLPFHPQGPIFKINCHGVDEVERQERKRSSSS